MAEHHAHAHHSKDNVLTEDIKDQPAPAASQPLPPTTPVPPTSTSAQLTSSNPSTVTILSLASIVLPFAGMSLIGLILGMVAYAKAKKTGESTTLAVVGMVISAVYLVLTTIFLVFYIALWAAHPSQY